MTQAIHNPHDGLFKSVWSRPEVARSFLRHYLPAEVVAELRLDTLELVRDAFVDERLKAHYSELLYRLAGRDGRPVYAYILMEHKSAPERDTAFQLLRYTMRICEKVKDEGTDPFPPRIVPILVYHGERPWPYGRTLHDA